MARLAHHSPGCAAILLVAAILLASAAGTARADIYRWDNGQLIPGTEGITPGPGVQVSGLDLRFANLDYETLDGGLFEGALLNSADFEASSLNHANFKRADLRGAGFNWTSLSSANFADAEVNNTNLERTTESGFTKVQLYSTASYKRKDLRQIDLGRNDLSGWDFSGHDMRSAIMGFSDLTNADFSGTSLIDARFLGAVLRGVNFSGAQITTADFDDVTKGGFTQEQLYSTASYKAGTLRKIRLYKNDLTGWDFSGQDLTGAFLNRSLLQGANMTDAAISEADFTSTVAGGFSQDQLYSTASYKAKDLQAMRFWNNDLSGWNFSGQNLRGTDFRFANLLTTNYSFADLRGTFGIESDSQAILHNAIRPDSTIVDLDLQAGELLVAYTGAESGVAVAGDFSIAPSATFDITDNPVAVNSTDPNVVDTVRQSLIAGRGKTGLGGAWTGTGITSSLVAAANQTAADSRSVGYARNGELPLGPYEDFYDMPVDGESILMVYTQTGDANLDGAVDNDDVTIVGAHYAPGVPKPHWALGDFDYNGFVDNDDVTLLGVFYDSNASSIRAPAANENDPLVAIPEPTAMALAVCAAMAAVLKVLRYSQRQHAIDHR